MTEILEQFSISLQEWLLNPLFNPFHYLLAAVCAFWLFRRISILRTGGEFWEPFHIVGDTLYIHAGLFCIGRRDVPFSEMRTVDIDYVRGKWGGRFTVQIHREKGMNKCFVLPADEKGKRQLKDLERALFQHRIAVRKWGY